MSFDLILVIALVVLSVITPLIAIFAFMKGYKTGIKDFNASHTEEHKAEPVLIKKKKVVPEMKELEKYNKILENIENYDGTDANQKEIS